MSFPPSKVSAKGRWIIVVIFVLAVVLPLSLLIAVPLKSQYTSYKIEDRNYEVGVTLVRLVWGAVFFGCILYGQTWARYLMSFLFFASVLVLVPFLSVQPVIVGIESVIYLASTAVLIFSKEVRAKHWM